MKLPGNPRVKRILLIVLVLLAICILIKTGIDNRAGCVISNTFIN